MQFDERRYRPLRTVDLFDEAFDIYKKNFVLLLGVAALVYVPLQTIVSALSLPWVLQVFNQAVGSRLSDPAAVFGSPENVAMIWLVLPFVNLIGFTLVAGALAKAVSACYLGEPITLWEAYKASFRKFLPNLIALFLDSLLIGLGSFCLVLFIVPLIRFLLVTPAAILEGSGPIGAMKRSSLLSRNNDWRLLSALMILVMLSFVGLLGLEGVLSLLTGTLFKTGELLLSMSAEHELIAEQIAGGLAFLLMLPFQVAVITLLYYDLRIRQEGYDMEILAERLGYPTVDYKSATPHAAVVLAGRAVPLTPKKGQAK